MNDIMGTYMAMFKYLPNRENATMTLSVAALFISAVLWSELNSVKTDIKELKAENKADIAEVKNEVRELKAENKADIRELRTLIIGLYAQKPKNTKQVKKASL